MAFLRRERSGDALKILFLLQDRAFLRQHDPALGAGPLSRSQLSCPPRYTSSDRRMPPPQFGPMRRVYGGLPNLAPIPFRWNRNGA